MPLLPQVMSRHLCGLAWICGISYTRAVFGISLCDLWPTFRYLCDLWHEYGYLFWLCCHHRLVSCEWCTDRLVMSSQLAKGRDCVQGELLSQLTSMVLDPAGQLTSVVLDLTAYISGIGSHSYINGIGSCSVHQWYWISQLTSIVHQWYCFKLDSLHQWYWISQLTSIVLDRATSVCDPLSLKTECNFWLADQCWVVLSVFLVFLFYRL